jgi:Protein of unknown function (DUF3592)
MRRRNRKLDIFWLKLLLPLFLAGILWLCWGQLANVRQQRRAWSYPTTTGRVYGSEIMKQWHAGGRHSSSYYSYDLRVYYTYEVNGTKYRGNRYRYGEVSDRVWAEAVAEALPAGTAVKVYYRPEDPNDAVLNIETTNSDLGLVLVLTLLLGMLLFLGAMALDQARTGMPPGVKVLRQGPQTRVRSGDWPPLVAGLCVGGMLAGASVFWAEFKVAFPNPGGTELGLGALVCGPAGWAVGWLACLLRWMILHAGHSDIVIDEIARTITLPKKLGRKDCVHLEFSQIAAVTVQKIPIFRGAPLSNFVPTLHVRGEHPQGFKLMQEANRELAENFAVWMRKELRLSGANKPNGNLPKDFVG